MATGLLDETEHPAETEPLLRPTSLVVKKGSKARSIISGGMPAAKAAADAAHPDVQVWEALVASVQRPLPHAARSEKWVAATRIFALADQP